MANYKNRKPRTWKGCCHLCAALKGHVCGMRNKRRPTLQELRSRDSARQQGG